MMTRVREIARLLPHVRQAPCHRDFTPRNWMVDATGTVRVIDFGHTRADGYGTRPNDEEWSVLEAVSALGAVSTFTWSREHGDDACEAHGRARLARLRGRHRHPDQRRRP